MKNKCGIYFYFRFAFVICIGNAYILGSKPESTETIVEAGSTTEAITSSTEAPTTDLPDSSPSIQIWPRNDFEAINYLIRYGYLQARYGWFLWNIVARDHLKAAIENYQRMAGIAETGKLDEETFRMMRESRCGVPDMSYSQGLDMRAALVSRTQKRFAVKASKWNHQIVTYRVSVYPEELSPTEVDLIIDKAFQIWNNVTTIQFSRAEMDPVDIDVKFLAADHNDGVPFDGPGGSNSHAFFPNDNSPGLSGDIHFDSSEKWSVAMNTPLEIGSTSLFCLAVHQIGHSLGLFHSRTKHAYLWPFLNDCNKTSMTPDHIEALRFLYADRTSPNSNSSFHREDTVEGVHSGGQAPPSFDPVTTTLTADKYWWSRNPYNRNRHTSARPVGTTWPYWYRISRGNTPSTPPTNFEPFPTTPRPQYCDGRLDAMTVATDHRTYGFRDNLVFRFNRVNVDYEFPKSISDVFPGGPTSVDAAVTFSKNRKKVMPGSTYLIKGNLVWRYRHTEEGFQLEHFYPKPWAREWDVTGTKIESAFMLGRKLYLLIDNRIWLLKGKKSRRNKFYEKNKIKLFNQIPDFQAAVQWINRNTYFFSGNEYYRVKLPAQRKKKIMLSGPRETAYWWFGCTKVPHIRQPFENDEEWDLELNK